MKPSFCYFMLRLLVLKQLCDKQVFLKLKKTLLIKPVLPFFNNNTVLQFIAQCQCCSSFTVACKLPLSVSSNSLGHMLFSFMIVCQNRPVGRVVTLSSLERGGLRFKFRAAQIGHSVTNGSPPLRHFFERSCVA